MKSINSIVVILGIFLSLSSSLCLARVRTVEVNADQVVTVKTSLGIATIIQVPDRPNSVVVGDQDSFKVEYLDQAITIKPLSSGAKSNLYVYTDWKRYNIELVTGPQSDADYVVYLNSPKMKKPSAQPVQWKKFMNSLKNEGVSLSVNRIGTYKKNLLLVEFTVSAKVSEKISPEWFWVTQSGEPRAIESLVFSGLDIGPQSKVRGLLQLRWQDINDGPVRIELRRKKLTYLTLPGKNSWK